MTRRTILAGVLSAVIGLPALAHMLAQTTLRAVPGQHDLGTAGRLQFGRDGRIPPEHAHLAETQFAARQ